MKSMQFVRLVQVALFCALLSGCKSYFNIDEYETKRARLYDAALTLCEEAQETSYWTAVDDSTKTVIETYRVPSLEVVLRAVSEMDNAENMCLADGFDEVLYEYDEALAEYNELIKNLK